MPEEVTRAGLGDEGKEGGPGPPAVYLSLRFLFRGRDRLVFSFVYFHPFLCPAVFFGGQETGAPC